MADLEFEELYQPVGAGETSIFEEGARVESIRKTDKARDEASFTQFTEGFMAQAKKSNTINKIWNWTDKSLHSMDDNDVYKKSMDDSVAMELLQTNDLQPKYFSALREAGSKEEQDYVINTAIREQETDEMINNTLSETASITASVTGALVDIDMAVGFGVGALYSKSANIAKILAYEGVGEVGLAATHMAMDEDYTLEDGVFDIVLGTSIAAGATVMLRGANRPRQVELTDKSAIKMSSDAEENLNKSMDMNFKVDIEGKAVDTVENKRIDANRKSFYETQSKTKEQFDVVATRNLDNIKAIESKLETHNAKLKELESSGGTKAKINYRKKF